MMKSKKKGNVASSKKKSARKMTLRRKHGGANQNRKLVGTWNGTLLNNNKVNIKIFTVPGDKRKPIISITGKPGISDDNRVTTEGPLLGLYLLPPSDLLGNFGGEMVYRLRIDYGVRGSYQGMATSFHGRKILFSKKEKQINEISDFLSKYTKNVKRKKS